MIKTLCNCLTLIVKVCVMGMEVPDRLPLSPTHCQVLTASPAPSKRASGTAVGDKANYASSAKNTSAEATSRHKRDAGGLMSTESLSQAGAPSASSSVAEQSIVQKLTGRIRLG